MMLLAKSLVQYNFLKFCDTSERVFLPTKWYFKVKVPMCKIMSNLCTLTMTRLRWKIVMDKNRDFSNFLPRTLPPHVSNMCQTELA